MKTPAQGKHESAPDREVEVDAHPMAKMLLVLAPFILGALVILVVRLLAG